MNEGRVTTICVAEDDEGLNSVITRKLGELGLNVRPFFSADGVYDAPPSDGVELWILDYDLAGVSAASIVKGLRARNRVFEFLVLTGRGDENSAVQMMKIGARDYLIKSFDTIEVLPGVVTRVIGEIDRETRLALAERRLHEYQEGLEDLVRERTAELRRQKDLNEALIRNVPDAVFAFDTGLILTRVNPAMGRLLKTDQGSIMAKTVLGVLQDLKNPDLIARLVSVLDGVSFTLHDVVLTIPGVGARSFDIFLSPLHGEGETTIAGGLVYLHDITEAKAYSESLRRSEARLRTILETIPIPMAIISAAEARLLFANPAFQPLLDLKVDDLIGRPFELFSDEIDRKLFTRAMEEAGFLFGYEMRIPAAGGRLLWVLLSAQRITLEQEQGYLLSMMDISSQKKVEEELTEAMSSLQRTQKQLISAEKLAFLGGLTAGIAHEIKNPLNFINNFALLSQRAAQDLSERIKTSVPNDEANKLTLRLAENLAIINKHGRRIDSIVRNMLLHSRGESGDKQPIMLNDLVQESVELAYHGLRAVDEKFFADTRLDLDPSVGTINGIPQDLGRVFVNLATNAYQALSEKSAQGAPGDYNPLLEVRTKLIGQNAEVIFRDNGTGIPEANLEKVFAPFFTTKTTGAGTGLGLSLSYDTIVHVHRGQISVQSSVGEYTEFMIRLPKEAEAESDLHSAP